MSEFAPERLHLATTSGPQATGDGVRLGQAAGATLVDMDQVQVSIAIFHRETPPFTLLLSFSRWLLNCNFRVAL